MKRKLIGMATKLVAIALISVLMIGCGTSGGSNNTAENESEVSTANEVAVPIKWFIAGSGSQADVETVQTAINEYLLENYDMNIALQIIQSDWANYPQKMQLVISSGEEYDICWTSSWNNNYYDNVNKNAFIQLNELLDSEAPELKASMSQDIWDGVKVNGNIYGIPSQQIFPKQNYVVIVKEYADKYNLDLDSISTLADLEPFFKEVKADNPEMFPFAASSNGLVGKHNVKLGFEEIVSVNIPGAVYIGDDGLQVFNQFESDEIKEFYEMMYRWAQDGIIRLDALTIENNAVAGMKAGEHIAAINATYKPGVAVTEAANFGGKEIVLVTLSEPYLATSSLVSSLNAISQTSKNPEVAMRLLNLVNTDPVLYNLFCFGVEGVHYDLDDQGLVISDDSRGYNPNVDWMFGNQFNGLLRVGQEADEWEQTKVLNNSSKESLMLGFAFDSTGVANEIAAVTAVFDQYGRALETGGVNPDTVLPEFIEKLKTAGSEVIVAEMQRQLDEWKAAN